jgi:hypothetical protein
MPAALLFPFELWRREEQVGAGQSKAGVTSRCAIAVGLSFFSDASLAIHQTTPPPRPITTTTTTTTTTISISI